MYEHTAGGQTAVIHVQRPLTNRFINQFLAHDLMQQYPKWSDESPVQNSFNFSATDNLASDTSYDIPKRYFGSIDNLIDNFRIFWLHLKLVLMLKTEKLILLVDWLCSECYFDECFNLENHFSGSIQCLME